MAARSRFAVLVCFALGAPLGVASGQPIKAGSEFQATTFTVNAQTYPALGMASDGDFVVVWASNTQDGNGYGVFARRYDSAGTALASEFRANGFTTGSQSTPAVGMDGIGGFVLAWASQDQDGSAGGIFGRRFNSSGGALAVEFQINTVTAETQSTPALAMNSAGDFVVAWSSYGQDGSSTAIAARRFNSSGSALGSDFLVNSFATGVQSSPAVGIDSARSFVVAWRSYGQDGSQNGVFARRFNSSGGGLAAEFQVNSFTLNPQRYPAVGMASGGAFVVAWESQNQDGQNYGIFAKRFSSSGVAQASEFLANAFTANAQQLPKVAMKTDGSFLLTWQDAQQDAATFGVFARLFDANGVPLGIEVQVNTYSPNTQNRAAAATDGVGRFVIAWESYGQDGQVDGIFAQRFAKPLAVLDVDGDGEVEPLTDSLLVLRYTFGFRGNTLITGAVDLVECTRCDAPSIEAYLAALV